MDGLTEFITEEPEKVSMEDAFSAFNLDIPEQYRDMEQNADASADESDDNGGGESGASAAADTDGTVANADDSDESGSAAAQTHEQREAHKAARLAGRGDLHEEINRQFEQYREQAQQQARAQLDELVASLGIMDSVTGEPIRTKEQLEASRAAAEAAALQARLSSGEILPDDITKVVSDALSQHPDIIAARAVSEQAAQQQAEQLRAQIDAEIAHIGQYDPAVKTVRDLTTLDRYGQMRTLIERGATALQAYEAVYRDKIESARIEKLVAAELKKRTGKNHLQTADIGSGGAGAGADVTLEQIKAFRKFPQYRDMSSEEIRKIIAGTIIVSS